MTFEELNLAMAVLKASRDWKELKNHRERFEFSKQVLLAFADMTGDTVFPFNIDAICQMRVSVRKNKMTRTKARVALRYGTTCFWSGRGKGRCSDLAEVGHLVPKARNGSDELSNLMIECRAHNNQRRDMQIEEYLSTDLQTGL